MSDRIWTVTEQAYDSYEGLSQNFETISIHKTKEGADKVAEKRRKANAISAVTGEMYDSLDNVPPDAIVEACETRFGSEMADYFKQQLAVPGAEMLTIIRFMTEKFGISEKEVHVTSSLLLE